MHPTEPSHVVRFVPVGHGLGDFLAGLLPTPGGPHSSIVYTEGDMTAEIVVHSLRKLGFDAHLYNRRLARPQREALLGHLRANRLDVLVVSSFDTAKKVVVEDFDDFTGVSRIVHYDLPRDVAAYVRRARLLGIAGGRFITLLAPRDTGEWPAAWKSPGSPLWGSALRDAGLTCDAAESNMAAHCREIWAHLPVVENLRQSPETWRTSTWMPRPPPAAAKAAPARA